MSAWLIAANDWRRHAVQPFAWALAAVVLALMAWQFLVALGAYLQLAPKLGALPNAPGVTDLVAIPLLRSFSNLLLLIVPLLTMRAFAGERQLRTLPLLLAAGAGDTRIVLGKFFGVLPLALALVVLVAAMPLSLASGTSLDLGKLAAATLGMAVYAAALVAIGVACSAWVAQPALAAGLAVAIGGALSVLDLGARFEGIGNSAINWFALPTHLEPFLRGIVASVDIGYFVLICAVALALTVRRLHHLRQTP